MALVVGLTTVVTEEGHGVVVGNVLGVVGHELLGALPEGRDGVNVLVKTENEAVFLALLGNDTEGVVVDITEELDGGLNAPVVLVVHHQRLAEEKSRLESAHVTVADGVSVDDLSLLHVLTNLLGLVLVNPLREGPMLLGDQTVVSFARNQSRGDLLEDVVERLVVKEDPVVSISVIESILDLANGRGNLPDVTVSGKSNKSGVHARAGSDIPQVAPARVGGLKGHGHLNRSVRLGSFVALGLLGGDLVLRQVRVGSGRRDGVSLGVGAVALGDGAVLGESAFFAVVARSDGVGLREGRGLAASVGVAWNLGGTGTARERGLLSISANGDGVIFRVRNEVPEGESLDWEC